MRGDGGLADQVTDVIILFLQGQQTVFETGQKVACVASFDGQLRKWCCRGPLLLTWAINGPPALLEPLGLTNSLYYVVAFTDPAEVIDKRINNKGEQLYYVHYTDCELSPCVFLEWIWFWFVLAHCVCSWWSR